MCEATVRKLEFQKGWLYLTTVMDLFNPEPVIQTQKRRDKRS